LKLEGNMQTAFVGGPVFLGRGRILERATVLVRGERIAKVTEGEAHVPKDARRISLAGRMLFPGFIDCHVHLCFDASADPVCSLLSEPAAMTALKGAGFARQTLMAGITSVRDMGGRDGVDLTLREAVRSGLIPGPRVLASGRVICMTGGQAWQVGEEADGPDEVVKAVRKQIKAGVDFVKFMSTGGVMTPGVEPGNEQFTEEEIRSGIQEAHKAGKRTAAHAQGREGILIALRSGIDSIEHGIFLDDEVVSGMVRGNVPLVPTLSALYRIVDRGVDAGIPAFAVNKARRVKPFHLESVQMAREAGVRVAMGTDAGTPFNLHGGNLAELQHLVALGFSTTEAVDAGTRIAAEVLGVENELGTIDEGKLADLVVVAGNPLEKIGLLSEPEAILMVMQGGVLVKE
jgi:imidazolonepropionase-like amidohydrolase